ncbi:MAG: cysteine desulfurase family protein [Rhodospirillaceae bacterium]|jgi:cysteine desulfurase
MNEPVYLDHNATTPIRPEALEASRHVLSLLGNPSSVHKFGRDVRRYIEDAREALADFIHAEPADIIFTSGGTEANSLALCGIRRDHVFVSAVEHVSVLDARDDIKRIPVDQNGIVDCTALEALLSSARSESVLVSVMLANNETGVIQPIETIIDIAKKHAALVHCDAVQGTAKTRLDFAGLGLDMMSISSHKIGGPHGAGALIVKDTAVLKAIIKGGGQERGYRGGTENAPGIAGLGAAVQYAGDIDGEANRLRGLQAELEKKAHDVMPATQIFGENVERLANTTCLTLPGVSSETQVMALDLAGVAVSAGAACSSGKVGASHVLEAMGAGNTAAEAIRVSLGWTSTSSDIERFIDAWKGLGHKVQFAAQA